MYNNIQLMLFNISATFLFSLYALRNFFQVLLLKVGLLGIPLSLAPVATITPRSFTGTGNDPQTGQGY